MKTSKLKYLAVGAVAVSVLACGETDEPQDADARTSALANASSSRYIVAFDNSRGRAAVAAAGGTVKLELPAIGAAAVELPDTAVAGLQRAPGIGYVEPDYKRYPSGQTTPYGIDMVLAPLDPSPLTEPLLPGGSTPTKICIIDSGYDLGHPDLPDSTRVSGDNDPEGSGNWYEDESSHGTHVAGTIAAVNNDLGVVGVGPDAISLHIVKVFDASGWAYSSTLVDAASKCETAGARVISMSLGGTFKSRSEDRAFAKLYNAGVLSIAAAGNDGNTRKSYPASYDSVMSVAAIDDTKTVASFSQQNSAVEIAAPGVNVLSTVPYLDETTVTLSDGTTTVDNNRLEFASDGDATGSLVHGGLCDSVASHSGAVVLCDRGSISFVDKVANAEAGGAVAVLVANNEPGNFYGTLGDGNHGTTIPALSISQEDGDALKASHLDTTVSVYALYDPNGHGYAYFNGTSMATPHVSGVAGLVWSHDPAWTAADIREALTLTAEDLGDAGVDNAYGHGLVQAEAALAFLTTDAPTCEPTESSETLCEDGLDNDCDGLVDAGDDDCSTDDGGGTCSLGAVGDPCNEAADCCSNKCKGKPTATTCK